MNAVIQNYKKNLIRRYDDEGFKKFFKHTDFDGLHKRDISFRSAQGNFLKGGVYFYDGYDKDKLVVFCHGLGEGHLAYMREIETLCKHGFRVLAFDNTGCASSEGENIRGLSQSLSDLDSCFSFIERDEEMKGLSLFVIGHSWGGYAAGNLLNYRKNIEKAVVLSGFVSIKIMAKSFFKGVLRFLSDDICRYERKMNPAYADSSAVTAYENTKAKVLVIHSEDDPLVDYRDNVSYLQKRVKNRNVTYLTVKGKKHNPTYTRDAVDYMNETFSDLDRQTASGKLSTAEEKRAFLQGADWYRMTAQDEEVFSKIVNFFKGDLSQGNSF